VEDPEQVPQDETASSRYPAASGDYRRAESDAEREAERDGEGNDGEGNAESSGTQAGDAVDREWVRRELDRWLGPVEALDDEIRGRNDAERFDPPGGWMPGDELAESDRFPHPLQPNYRQVGVRLKWPQYGELEHAARLYGLKPTTLARALINRGARAILDAYRREELLGRRPPPPPAHPDSSK
jgi:hypothetical protein